jgi:hypothetical protein
MASFPPIEQIAQPPYAAKNASSPPTAPINGIPEPTFPILKNSRIREPHPAQAQCPRPPLRQLAPKPPPPPTPGMSRRDSLINDSDNFIVKSTGPTSPPTPTTSGLGPLTQKVHVKSRTKPRRATQNTTQNTTCTNHNTNTNSNAVINTNISTTTIHPEEPAILSRPTKSTAEPAPAHKEAEEDAEDREERDHRNGLHEGRDPYGLASKPFLDRGERLPWGRCVECEKEKGEKRGGSMMEGWI